MFASSTKRAAMQIFFDNPRCTSDTMWQASHHAGRVMDWIFALRAGMPGPARVSPGPRTDAPSAKPVDGQPESERKASADDAAAASNPVAASVAAAANPAEAVVSEIADAVNAGQPPIAPALPPEYPPPPKYPPAPPPPPNGGPVVASTAKAPGATVQVADAEQQTSAQPSVVGTADQAASPSPSAVTAAEAAPDSSATPQAPAPTQAVATDPAAVAAAAAMQERIEALERWRLQQLQESFAKQHEAERAAEALEAGLDPQATLQSQNSVVIAGVHGGPSVETAVPKRRRSTGNSDGYLMTLRMRGRRMEVESLTAEVMELKNAMEMRWKQLASTTGGDTRSSVTSNLGVPMHAAMTAARPPPVLLHEEGTIDHTPFKTVHESITKVRQWRCS